jgi:formate dehydrogenase beta subunit
VTGIIESLNALLHEKGYLQNEDHKALAETLNVPLFRLEGLVPFSPHFRRTPPPRAAVTLCRDVARFTEP